MKNSRLLNIDMENMLWEAAEAVEVDDLCLGSSEDEIT